MFSDHQQSEAGGGTPRPCPNPGEEQRAALVLKAPTGGPATPAERDMKAKCTPGSFSELKIEINFQTSFSIPSAQGQGALGGVGWRQRSCEPSLARNGGILPEQILLVTGDNF